MTKKLNLNHIIGGPRSIHLVAEMGAGKSTFLELLINYEWWLSKDTNLEGRLIAKGFVEDIPHDIWKEYQIAMKQKTPSKTVYQAQSFFMDQKLRFVAQASGVGYEREHGLYVVERDPREDYHVFASRLKKLFLNGEFEKYEDTYGPKVKDSLIPDLIVRLRSSPEVSMKRVQERKTGELLELVDYQEMEALYTIYVDKWIRTNNIPCIDIDTSLEKFDFNTRNGQNYFLTEFFTGLSDNGYWKLDKHILQVKKLLNLNNGTY